jgi:two-component system, LytTR family, response regulator
MIINCVIIEDEPLALERTKNFVALLPFVNIIASFENGLDALLFLKRNAVDLILLDINIGEITGIQLLEAAKPGCEVIIITAYHEYAIKGFELQVTDYLLKPFTFERFFQAVERAQTNLLRKQSPKERRFLFVKTEYRLEKLLLGEILYIEGMRDYRRIHTAGKLIMTLQTFKEFEQLVPPEVICRVHKSYMVALDKIDSVERDHIKIKNTFIPISDTYKNAFFSLIKR